ncbi:hypothetical protein WQ78_25860, partial [Escherichia coli]
RKKKGKEKKETKRGGFFPLDPSFFPPPWGRRWKRKKPSVRFTPERARGGLFFSRLTNPRKSKGGE